MPVHLSNRTGFQTHVDSASVVATGISRTVVCRAQPPSSRRLWLSAKDHFRLGKVPWSVRGGITLSLQVAHEAPAVLPTDWSSYAAVVLEALGPVPRAKPRPGRQR